MQALFAVSFRLYLLALMNKYIVTRKMLLQMVYTISYNISHQLLRPSQFLKKIPEILEWSTFQK